MIENSESKRGEATPSGASATVRHLDLLSSVLEWCGLTGVGAERYQVPIDQVTAFGAEQIALHLTEYGPLSVMREESQLAVLETGDAFIVLKPFAHSVKSALPSLLETPAQSVEIVSGHQNVEVSAPEQCRWVTGRLSFDGLLKSYWLPGFPDFIHVRGLEGSAALTIKNLISMLLVEEVNQSAGGSSVIKRLIEVIFVQCMRNSIHSAGLPAGWFQALENKDVAELIYSILHDRSHQSIDELIVKTGVPASSILRHFQRLVGTTPGAFRRSWQLELAKLEMMSPESSLAQIASGAGYSSVRSFSGAFKDAFQMSPREYKRSLLQESAPMKRNGRSAFDS